MMAKKRFTKICPIGVIAAAASLLMPQLLFTDQLFHDTNRHEGRNISFATKYDYIDVFNYFLKKYHHNLSADIATCALIAQEYHFTERDIECIVQEAHKLSTDYDQNGINKDALLLVINGYKNDKIIDLWIEQQQPEHKIRERIMFLKNRLKNLSRLLYIWDICKNPDTSKIEKIGALFIEVQEELSQLVNNTISYLRPTTTTLEDQQQWTAAPHKQCHLNPYLAGNQPQEICQIVRHLLNPDRYKSKLNNTLVLYGPPGTGKTVIAQAIKKILDQNKIPAQMIERPASSLMTEYQAAGSIAIQDIFDEVKKITEAGALAIVFIDEIDAVAQNRDSVNNQDARQTLNQLLVEISKHKEDKRVLIIFATNLEHELDKAFNNRVTKIHIPRPDEEKLGEIFKFYLSRYDEFYKSEQAQESVKRFSQQAYKTKYTGRDIEKIVNQAKENCEEKNINGIIEEAVFEEIKKKKSQV